jgi:hypothetical protein
MKNITKSLFLLLSVFALSCSSDDVEDRPVIVGGDAPVLLAPAVGTSYALSIDNADLQAERFVWTNAEFGQDVVVTYTLEIDKADNDFAAPQSLGSAPGANQLPVSVVSLNNAVIALGGEPEVGANYEVRVKATLNNVFEPLYSNSVTISVTPYQAFVPLQNLYIVGDATEYGYNNNGGNAPMFRDAVNQNLYYFTGYFTANGIKVLSSLGSWHPQYGSAGSGILGVSGTDGSNEPSPITVPTAGYYTLTINTDEMTYSLVPFEGAVPAAFPTVGIIGDATPGGWDNDTDMTNSAANPHIWKLDNVQLTDAKVKFRANNSWDLPGNWGGGTPVSGVMTENGSDFQGVPAPGTYDVWFNDLDKRYIFIMQ